MSSRKVRRDGKPVIAGALWTVLLIWTVYGGGAERAAGGAELASVIASNPTGNTQSPDLLARALQGPLSDAEEIVFAVRSMGSDGHWYANFGHRSTGFNDMNYGPDGGRLCRLNLRTGRLTSLLDDPAGSVRDPQVHYDGGKILFSYRPGGSRYFHLYEIGVDGSNIRQLTDGPFDDLEPIYLPDGDIMFCSSRCNRFVQCWFTQVAILYRCDADGRGLHPVSANIEQDNTPWMMSDGRVLYMRWEYVDRSRVAYHHLWTINPDGSGVMIYFGNMHGGTVMLDAKPIPGTNLVASIFSPGHGQKDHAGQMAIVDTDAGPDNQSMVRFLDGKRDQYRDPYPLSRDLFLVAEADRLLLMDGDGRTQEIYRLDQPPMMLHEPRPLRGRPREPIIPTRTDQQAPTGRLILSDVNRGRNMAGVRPGEIKKLLVLETLPKPVNFSGSMEPISFGGTFTLPRILGTVPVEPDGSAYMELPALRPLFFVALDENDLSVKRMQSFVSVMPNETTSCVGCHENRTSTPAKPSLLMATERPPSRIEPIAGVPDVLDFPRDIQPILDRHCVECHNYDRRPDGDLPLVGDHGPWYSHGYVALMARGYVAHGRDGQGNLPPRTIGTSASRLMKTIDGSHYGATLSPLEQQTIRLWIEAGAPYPGTYAALGSGMVRPNIETLQRRCVGCHTLQDDRGRISLRLKSYGELLFNLSHPAQSPGLLAPLAAEAGGWGLCKDRRSGKPIFNATDDPDYVALLGDITEAAAALERIKRFDMPGFRPNEHYIREMRRFGMLPENFDAATDPIDVYQLDQKYWQSFWHRPAR